MSSVKRKTVRGLGRGRWGSGSGLMSRVALFPMDLGQEVLSGLRGSVQVGWTLPGRLLGPASRMR